MSPPSLGCMILYVSDVAASLAFYEKAFGLVCRFFHDDNGKTYGELETGATRRCVQRRNALIRDASL